MTTITSSIRAPAGLVNLKAPIPAPRQYDLLAAATLIEPTDARWFGGAWIGGDVPGPAFTHDPCSSGTDRIKAGPGDIPQEQIYTFNVYLPGFCTAQSIGPDPTFFKDRLKLMLQAYEGAAVERVFATGDGHGTLGPYLADANVDILDAGSVTPRRALQLLETNIAEHATGIIHVTPAIATEWAADFLIRPVGNVLRTALGTPVAVGPGYIGAFPDSKTAPASDHEWAWASGPLEIRRDSNIDTIADNYAESFDRTNNDVLFIAERPYLLNWIGRQDPSDEGHTQAAVLIDLTP